MDRPILPGQWLIVRKQKPIGMKKDILKTGEANRRLYLRFDGARTKVSFARVPVRRLLDGKKEI